MEALLYYVKFYGPDLLYWVAVAVVFELATLGTKRIVRWAKPRVKRLLGK